MRLRYYVPVCALLLLLGGVGTGVLSLPALRTAYRRIRNKTDASEGRALFLANCGPCHGLAARGGRGPALVGRQLVHGSSDKDILTVIHDGIPGTTMPAFNGSPDEEHNIMAYLRSLSGAAASNTVHPHGDAARGSAVYERYGCAGCHRIGDRGSVFGPELTRVGVARSYDYLRQSLLDPSAEITPGSEGITATTLDGRRVVGIRVNEDTFTVQLRDQSQQFVMFEKNELKTLIHETKSLMPSYATLPGEDLEDLLAYLSTLHGDVNAGAGTSSRVLR
jgi:cytochrome c oxidase cbb3-type subunit 3